MVNIEAPIFQDEDIVAKIAEEAAKADIAREHLNREVPIGVLPVVEETESSDDVTATG